MKHLNELLPIPISGGLFASMEDEEIETPWSEMISGAELDMFFYSRYGMRIASPLLMSFTEDGELPDEMIPEIATLIYGINSANWARLWENFVAEYDPISNYDMTESETIEGQTDYGHVNTREDDLTSDFSPRSQVETERDTFGFNSASGVPTEKNTVTGISGKDTTENSGTQTNTESGTDSHSEGRTLTRAGNIGVTTASQMIASNIELWKWNYFDSVFADVCKYLAIPIY